RPPSALARALPRPTTAQLGSLFAREMAALRPRASQGVVPKHASNVSKAVKALSTTSFNSGAPEPAPLDWFWIANAQRFVFDRTGAAAVAEGELMLAGGGPFSL